jgi:RNA polymerase sigma-54 factor
MALELKQQLKLTQQLVMTPQLQQAIKLLQLSTLELQTVVEQELVENPCLEESADEDEASRSDNEVADERTPTDGEIDGVAPDRNEAGAAELDGNPEVTEQPTAEEVVGDVDWENYMESRPQTSLGRPDDDRPSLEDNLSPGHSLADYLMWQLGFLEVSEAERSAGTLIIGNLNDDGYLQEEISVIAEEAGIPEERAEAVLLQIQEFDPIGVATRGLSECLMVQARLAGISDPLVLRIIEKYLDQLQRKDYRSICRQEDVTVERVSEAAHIIGSFEPRPGRQFASDEPIYITPDIFVHKVGDEFHVVLNEDGMPKLRVSSAYRDVLSRKQGSSKETRDYVRDKLRSAVWLIKSIHQRQRTIVRVTESIVRFQGEFFERGVEHLRPLNLRDVAEDIGMHESTVSRVTSNKYVQTPHGLFELKFFFNSSIQTSDGTSIASESVKEKIREIVRKEDPRRPLSDQQIVELLSVSSIHIARRTVTKYREAMRILPSTRRREIG